MPGMTTPTQGSQAPATPPSLAEFKALAAADPIRSELLAAIDPAHNSTAPWDVAELEETR